MMWPSCWPLGNPSRGQASSNKRYWLFYEEKGLLSVKSFFCRIWVIEKVWKSQGKEEGGKRKAWPENRGCEMWISAWDIDGHLLMLKSEPRKAKRTIQMSSAIILKTGFYSIQDSTWEKDLIMLSFWMGAAGGRAVGEWGGVGCACVCIQGFSKILGNNNAYIIIWHLAN